MATDIPKRLRACTGGFGRSTRMADRASSFQTRATLCAKAAENPALQQYKRKPI
jgi:hypothetical protein